MKNLDIITINVNLKEGPSKKHSAGDQEERVELLEEYWLCLADCTAQTAKMIPSSRPEAALFAVAVSEVAATAARASGERRETGSNSWLERH